MPGIPLIRKNIKQSPFEMSDQAGNQNQALNKNYKKGKGQNLKGYIISITSFHTYHSFSTNYTYCFLAIKIISGEIYVFIGQRKCKRQSFIFSQMNRIIQKFDAPDCDKGWRLTSDLRRISEIMPN